MKLQTGNYKYPFQFPLPPHDLPTSFEGSSGSVRYWLDAVLDRGSWKTDIHIQKPLFIVEQLEIRDPTLFVSIARPLNLDNFNSLVHSTQLLRRCNLRYGEGELKRPGCEIHHRFSLVGVLSSEQTFFYAR